MDKLPPIQKIAEAYSSIADNRIKMMENSAKVISSNRAKEYSVYWIDNTYNSNDSASYWQGYAGYPIIAVLMLQGKLKLNREIANYFKGINWTDLNNKYKRKYDKAVAEIMEKLQKEKVNCKDINDEISKVFEEIKKLNIEVKRSIAKVKK